MLLCCSNINTQLLEQFYFAEHIKKFSVHGAVYSKIMIAYSYILISCVTIVNLLLLSAIIVEAWEKRSGYVKAIKSMTEALLSVKINYGIIDWNQTS